MLPEHLSDPQDEVGGGRAFCELAGELEAHDLGQEHVDRLADHRRLGFDPADTPADDAEPVDHRGVRIRPDEAVRIEVSAIVPGDLGEVLEVDLVHDAGRRRHDAEVVEGRLTPLQELVAFLIPFELTLRVDLQRHTGVEGIDLDRVIDDEVARHEWVDLLRGSRVAGHPDDGGPHRREVHDRGYAGEVLEHDAAGGERDLGLFDFGGVVLGEGLDVAVRYDVPVVVAQHRLEEHLDRVRQRIDVAEVLERIEAIDHPLSQRRVDRGSSLERIVDL